MSNENQPDKQANQQNTASTADANVNWDEQIDFLRGLAQIVKDERLSELSVESQGVRLSFKGTSPGMVMMAAPSVGLAVAGARNDAAAPQSGTAPVVSPMVGMFYRAPSPADDFFVEVGDTVHVGQVIGVVEAMKVFNEIVSDIEGTVSEIVAQNAELVETGQTLILVKKA